MCEILIQNREDYHIVGWPKLTCGFSEKGKETFFNVEIVICGFLKHHKNFL